MTVSHSVAADPLSLAGELGVVPVLVLEDPAAAGEVGAALHAGGLPLAEITFRRPGATDAIRAMVEAGLVVGAGTVISSEQVERAAAAGASFVVSPGLDPDVLASARRLGLPALPGVATATEVQHALRLGVEIVKFFPAGILGGARAVAALSAPFPQLRWMPTGGVASAEAAADYLRLPAVHAVGGSWLTPSDVIRERRWDEIAERARDAVVAARVARSRS